MIYYIDPHYGTAGADGLSPEKARTTYTDLALQPGDTVLFRRGSFIRDILYRTAGAPGAPITYGAYGEGENPVFCGSVDVSDPEMWEEIRPCIWQYKGTLENEVCNFIYDNGRIGGTLRWEEDFLCAQGDWYDSSMGYSEQSMGEKKPQRVLVWSDGNPGKVYSHIECAIWGKRWMAVNRDWTITEDLCFRGSGVHGMAGGADNVIIRRCSFCFIGGAVWNRQLRIRFGNAIEFWDHGENILIEDCYFNNIYDSCITHQGSAKCLPAKNLVMRNNLFIGYGMGAYEGRDRMSIDSSFTDNICIGAGAGFSGFGDTSPRNSEIYPQPMGHHVFMWRIPNPTEGGCLEFARNRFYDATGAAMYAIIGKEADAQMDLHDNVYWTTNETLFQHAGGRSYSPAQFDAYLQEYRDPGSVWAEAPDLTGEAEAWFARTGVSRNGTPLFTDTLPARKYFIGGTWDPAAKAVKDALSYGIGDDICFRVTLTEAGEPITAPYFSWECWGEDGSHNQGIVSGQTGTFEYHTFLTAPGYVKMYVYVSDENRNRLPGYDTFEGGAAVCFDKIRKAGSEPADYDAWWAGVIADELDKVEPAVLEQKEFHCGDPGDVVYDMKIACAGPMPVSGYLRLPRNAENGSLPIIVSYMGYSVSTATIPTKAEAIQFLINPHGFANGLSYDDYQALAAEAPYASFGFHKDLNADPHTVYFKYMILRALQAIRFCKTLPLWDGRTITSAGGSMGAFQATHAAAFDKDVTKLDIIVPWMCDLRGRTESGRLDGWLPEAAHGLDYYDTAAAGARVTCPVTISAGLGDYVCPPSGITSLYHAIPGEVRMEMLQNRTHGYTAPKCDTFIVSKK